METVQPWASGFNRPKPLTTQMQNGLSREERMEAKRLYEEANSWELSHGGRSGRTARQFIDHLLGTMEE